MARTVSERRSANKDITSAMNRADALKQKPLLKENDLLAAGIITPKSAARISASIEKISTSPAPQATEGLTLNDYFEEWIGRKRRTAAKPATPYRYNMFYRNHLARGIGGLKIGEIRRRDVLQLQADLLERVSAGTVNYIIQLLKQILGDAVADEIIEKNPAGSVKRLKATSTAIDTNHRALTEEEQVLFMGEAKKTYYYEFFAFLLLTGMRQGEGAALRWADVDWDKNLLHVRATLSFDLDGHVIVGAPKSAAGQRDIPMNAGIRRILEMQRAKAVRKWDDWAADPARPVFPSSIGGLMGNATANQAIVRILRNLDKAGTPMQHFSCHAFRDTFATRFIEQGGNPQTLKTILGHSSLKMTMDLYSHVLPNTKQKEMDMVKIII